MKHLIFLLLILGLAGCQNQAKEVANSLDIVEQNIKLINKGMQAKQDIEAIKKTVELRNQDILEQLEQTPPASDPPKEDKFAIPDTFDLPVKFVPQAPFAIWDELHKEACEEAAMIAAVKYLKNEDLNKQIMENEILALVKWEKENGYKIDLTAFESVEILKNYFNIDAQAVREVAVERIKQELALGNLVITPHAGRELGNPYYRQPGPRYHFLVIRGWDKDEFITNDVGTKRGEGYKYKYDTITETMHDWNDGQVEAGERIMIVIGKQIIHSGVDKVFNFLYNDKDQPF